MDAVGVLSVATGLQTHVNYQDIRLSISIVNPLNGRPGKLDILIYLGQVLIVQRKIHPEALIHFVNIIISTSIDVVCEKHAGQYTVYEKCFKGGLKISDNLSK